MNSAPAPLPGVVRQIGYIVSDFDKTVESWLALGIGPWYVLRHQVQTGNYRGKPCTVTLSLGFANTGDMQVEVIHQEDDTPSIYQEFLDSGREGYHQLAWWVTDVEATSKATGWPIVWSGGDEGSARFAYVEPPAGPTAIVEIMELTPVTQGMADLVRGAAADWDGSDPVRSLR
jgi:hypothetical protein